VRFLTLLPEIALVVALMYVAYVAMTRRSLAGRSDQRRLTSSGRWRPNHYAEDGQTVVVVARVGPTGEVLEEHVVARIPDADPQWSSRFVEAKQEAEERAFHLNADSGT
jgi:hypothetical protein